MSPRSTHSIFEDVPFDVWSQIFDYLRWDSWANLKALSLSCQALHKIVLPLLYKMVHIHFPKRKATGHLKLKALLNPELGRRVHHHVQVLIMSYGHTFQDKYSSLICTLVGNLLNLEIVRWRLMPFPPGVLSNFANRQHPPTIYYEGDPRNLVTFDNRLATCIKSLSLTLGRDRPAHVDPDVKRVALRSLLPTLPNLTRLALKYHPSVRGGSRPVLELPQGSALDSVQDLTLANFSFSADQAASWIRYLEAGTRLRRLALDGTADDLYKFVEKLSTSSVSTKLTSLSLRIHDKTVDGISPQLREALYALLDNIAHLREFLVYDLPKDILHSAVRSHGDNLRHLRFRHTNHSHLDGPRHPVTHLPTLAEKSRYKGSLFSPDELKNLVRQLPFLERLGIDLCFAGDLHLDILHAVASFPSLKFVELNTPHPWRMPSYYVPFDSSEPWLNASIAQEIFHHVAEQKDVLRCAAAIAGIDTQPWSKLMGLDIKEGEWEPLLKDYMEKRLHGLSIYTCWRDTSAAGSLGGTVRTLQLPCKSAGYATCIEDNMYEQTMLSARLWKIAHADFGPAMW